MKLIADLHIHSRFSRATGHEMDVEWLDKYAGLKGISVLGTGDFTHPGWLEGLKEKLSPDGNGLFRFGKTQFILSAEVSLIFNTKSGLKRIHLVLLAPDFKTVEKINKVLSAYGNLYSDGRPTLSVSAEEAVRIMMDISDRCMAIPAHAWTPWFSVFGSHFGFDRLEECFGKQTKHIRALETGLSSDPEMNRRWSALDNITMVSNSDAHSPIKIGREANVFDIEPSFDAITGAIKNPGGKFLYTIEFYPEEGKYHYDGHRICKVCLPPEETRKKNGKCPVCGRIVTVGVMHRVELLADRKTPGKLPVGARKIIPLIEVIAEAMGKTDTAKAVTEEYFRLTSQCPEFAILLDLTEPELERLAGGRLAGGIMRMRKGEVKAIPGYDGEYGRIKVFVSQEQKGLFD